MIVSTHYSGIYASTINDSSEDVNHYVTACNSALDKINYGHSGQKLLSDINRLTSSGKRKVTIREAMLNEEASTIPLLTASQIERHGNPRSLRENTEIAKTLCTKGTFSKAEGTNAMITWGPGKCRVELTRNGSPIRITEADNDDNFSVLAHELIHAKHILNGSSYKYKSSERYDTSTSSGKEEMRAVGIQQYKYSKTGEPSENSIRAEHGLLLRNRYGPPHSSSRSDSDSDSSD